MPREVYRFRARHFPELAARDYARAVESGWAHHVWDEHGQVRPPEPVSEPSSRMVRQHVECCAAVRASFDKLRMEPDRAKSDGSAADPAGASPPRVRTL